MNEVNVARSHGGIIAPLQSRVRSIIHGGLDGQRVVGADLMVSIKVGVVCGDNVRLRTFAGAALGRNACAVLREVQVGQALGHVLVGGGELDVAILEAVAPGV